MVDWLRCQIVRCCTSMILATKFNFFFTIHSKFLSTGHHTLIKHRKHSSSVQWEFTDLMSSSTGEKRKNWNEMFVVLGDSYFIAIHSSASAWFSMYYNEESSRKRNNKSLSLSTIIVSYFASKYLIWHQNPIEQISSSE